MLGIFTTQNADRQKTKEKKKDENSEEGKKVRRVFISLVENKATATILNQI